MTKRGLGRGLDALLPKVEPTIKKDDDHSIVDIDIQKIDPNLNQPRKMFDTEALEELAQSIKNSGLITPILVQKNKERYQIIAGERRFRAAKLAGLSSLPCIIKEYTQEKLMQVALIENIQREDLNPIEEARALGSLMTQFKYTQEELANVLGKSRSSIANCLRLNKLADKVQQAILDRTLSFGHAKILAGIEGNKKQEELCALCIKNAWSVHQLEAFLKEKPSSKLKKDIKIQDAELQAFEKSIKQKFGVKAYLQGNQNKGKIVLNYANREELNHLYSIIENM